MIGRTLEHYQIETPLGAGGMGVIYKARDPRLDRHVAIKVLQPERITDPIARQRFIQEAKAASALNHPGIVTIYDIRSAEDTEFIVMEYLAGQTLDAFISPGGMPVDRLVRYAVQIAGALAAAHASGLVHRDLKPSNVMVLPEDRVKILDFGLAKLLEPAIRAPDATTIAALTEEHAVLGTAAYMSPEQAEGRVVDARSDIFSFGIMLYEMATGARPFTGESRLALLGRIVSEEPSPPSAVVRSVPAELDKTILRCLRKDPARRYQTMADLKVALEDVQAERAVPAVPATGARSSLQALWPWAVASLIVVGAGYVAWRSAGPAVAPEALRANALTTFPGAELYPSLSPSGDRVAFTWNGPRRDNTDIYVQQIGAGSPLRLTTDPRHDYNPAWSPDGRWIAFLRGDPARPLTRSERELRLVAPLGGPERKLADLAVQEITANPAFLAWCPDSTCVIATDSLGDGKPDALFVIALDSGVKTPLTNPPASVLADTNPRVSPDGRSLLFMRRSTWSFGEPHVLRFAPGSRAAGEPTRVPITGMRPDEATWLADGNELLLSPSWLSGGTQLWRVPLNGGTPTRLPYVGEDGIMATVSRAAEGSSRLVYVRSFIDNNIWRIDTDATGATASSGAVAIASSKQDIHPQLSPDGRRVAFTSTRSGFWEIWVSDLDGANAVQLTSLEAPTGTGAPRWSPDGQLIAFGSDAEGQFDVFVVRAAGGRPLRITSHPAIDHVPSFSQDGEWIYFGSARSGQFQVWKVAVAGGEPVQVTRDGGFSSQEAGGYLYFTASAAVGSAIPLWRMPLAGGPAVKLLDAVLNGCYTVTSRGIYSLIGDPEMRMMRVEFFDVSNRTSAILARDLGEGGNMFGFAASSDGRTLLYVRRESAVDDLMIVENFR